MNLLHRSRLLAGFAALCATLGAPPPLHAQAAQRPARTLSIFSGLFRPSDAAFRSVYGSAPPLAVQLEWRVHGPFAILGGVYHVGARGTAIVEQSSATAVGGAGDRAYDTHIALTALRAGGLVVRHHGAWDLAVGGGVSISRYAEEWNAAQLNARGSQAGWFVQARLGRDVGRRLVVSGGLQWTSATVNQGDGTDTVPTLRLGGLDLVAGAGIRF